MLLAIAGCGRIGFGGSDVDAGDGLVARYAMDNDATGGEVPATPAALSAHCAPCPAPSSGRIGAGYQLDGTQRVTLPSSTLIGLAPFTTAVWVKPSASGSLYSVISKPLNTTSVNNVFSLTIRGDTGEVAYESTDGAFAATGIDVRGAWHHLAASWDGTTRRLYIDGALVGSRGGAFGDSAIEIAFGADLDANAPDIFYVGTLDDLRFYGRALSDGELAGLAMP